ncbi:hypothetical protein H0H93_007483 [Arthromyces matolae]|nr:hypothetical protein H0H93_007483 [Arthromyces matolae]
MNAPSFLSQSSSTSEDVDAPIRLTDTDAALARLSAVKKGYVADPYIKHFVARAHLQPPRPPLINIGTYVRGLAIDRLVDRWFEIAENKDSKVQIVSLGAGSDTRFWRVETGKYRDRLARYVEIDFAEVTSKKAMAIRKSRELSLVLGEDVKVGNGGTTLHAEKYHLLGMDLRQSPETTLGRISKGHELILDPTLPTLLLFECVLVYMEPSASEAILRWFVEYFRPGNTALGGIVYEMFNLEDAFGKVMVNNLKVDSLPAPAGRMSKSSTASSAKPSLPSRSAWSKGPPQSTSRSQSPAPQQQHQPSHSRRPSTLGQGVPIKDGVTIPRGNASAIKSGSVVTFGSIDDDSAPISSSPAAAPTIKSSEGVKSFGSIPAQLNGKASVTTRPPTTATTATSTMTSTTAVPSSTSSPAPAGPVKLAKVDIQKLFQNPSSAPPSSAPSETSSPSLRTSSLPPPASSQHPSAQPPLPSQPSQLGSHSYQPFVPGGGRPHQNSASATRPPSSPNYPRSIPNGNGVRPSGGPNPPSSQIPAGLASPRMGHHPHPGSTIPPQIPQMAVPTWPSYYYPDQPYLYGTWYPHQGGPIPGHPHQPPHQPPHPGPHGPPHNGIPMSPHTQPPPLQPGTPTQTHAVPTNNHVPHQPHHGHSHSHSPSTSNMNFTSPPPTPSTATTRLSASSSAFIPNNRSSKITLKNPDGLEVDINQITKSTNTSTAASGSPSPAPRPGFRQSSPASPAMTPTRRPASIRIESEEQKLKRLAEEKKEKEDSSKAKADAEDKARKEKERKEKEEKDKKEKEEAEVKKKKEEEEKERIRQEEEKARLAKEEEQRKKQEEERRKKEEEEAQLKREEEERKVKEETERKLKEEEERKAKEEADKKQKEEEERLAQEAEMEQERLRLQAQEAAASKAAKAEVEDVAEASTPASEEANEEEEEGEVIEAESPKEPQSASTASPTKSSREALRVNVDLEKKPRRPGALDLSEATIKNDQLPVPLPSALSMARSIKNLGEISYPEGIESPQELHRYTREFMLQFVNICKEKPEGLPDYIAVGSEPNSSIGQDMHPISRSGSHHQRKGSTAQPTRQGSLGLGISGVKAAPPFAMGSFASGAKLGTSEERFAISNRAVSVGGNQPFGRPSPMTRTASQGGVGGTPMSTNRTRSRRGEKRNDSNRTGGRDGHAQNPQLPPEAFAPLQVTENRWDRKTITQDIDKRTLVDRKVKSLLNKLTMEKFDSISDQIVEWANKSEGETDGKTLMQVIRLVFDKATDEATWSEMYARLCRKMMERLNPSVRDDDVKGPDGKVFAGGQLFRKYLLNRCQDEFEHGWAVKVATAQAAASKAAEDEAIKAQNEKNGNSDETALYSDEYYAAQKAKRRGLGLIRFIGELFKLQMLTERIMHECLKKLLGNVDNPEEEDLESCCKLLMTVGSMLDTPRAANHMSVYFARITELRKSPFVSSRIQFLLQDVLELREKKWVSRTVVTAPSTIAQIHENAAKEKAAAEKDAYTRQISMSRSGSRRGGDRGDYPQVNPDGWAVAGGNAARPPTKAGDLSNFGKINKNTAAALTFGPSSVFTKKGSENKRESISRSSSSSNMFSMLSQGEQVAEQPKAPEPQRKRLVLAPRTKPTIDEQAAKSESDPESDGDLAAEAAEMTEEEANKKIAEDLKEFLAVRNLEEAENYLVTLPAVHHFRLVEKFTSRAIEVLKEADSQLLAEFFASATEKELIAVDALEQGFLVIAEVIDDIAIDAPKAFNYFAAIVKGAGLDDDRKALLASKSIDDSKLLELLS